MNRPIYLDYNATTPVDPMVLETMLPYLRDAFGNPSSTSHSYGWEASQAVESARKSIANLIKCQTNEIIWTSGATESNNMALFSVIRPFLQRNEKVHLITSQVEHKAVLDVAYALEQEGAEVTFLKPDQFGKISRESVERALKPHTKLVSIIMGQNEIGTINPIAEIGAIVRKHGALFHVDGAQTVGKIPINTTEMSIDLLSASGHKIYAPKGIGFLYAREGILLNPIFFGGSQECGKRPGTLNVPGIVAFGKACEICVSTMAEENLRLTKMRDQFIDKILNAIPAARLNGSKTERLYSNISLSFEGLSSDLFALGLSGLAVSSGSACSGGATSYILKAIGLSDSLARATIRIGIGRFTKDEDMNFAFNKIVTMYEKSKNLKMPLE